VGAGTGARVERWRSLTSLRGGKSGQRVARVSIKQRVCLLTVHLVASVEGDWCHGRGGKDPLDVGVPTFELLNAPNLSQQPDHSTADPQPQWAHLSERQPAVCRVSEALEQVIRLLADKRGL